MVCWILRRIIVGREYRLKGIAKNLCIKCEEWAENKGCKNLPVVVF